MTSERLMMKAREARRAKATASAEKRAEVGGVDNVIPSASSFVRPSANVNGKIAMNWQDLQASLTPPRPPKKSASRLTPGRSSSRPRSSPVVKSKTPTEFPASFARRSSSVATRRGRVSSSSNHDSTKASARGDDRASLRTKSAVTSELRMQKQEQNSGNDFSSHPRDSLQTGPSLQSRISSGIFAQTASSSSLSSNPNSPDFCVTRRAREAAAKLAARRRSSSKSPTSLTTPVDSEQTSAASPGNETLATPTQGLTFEFDREIEPTSGQGPDSSRLQSDVPPTSKPSTSGKKKTELHKKTVKKGATTEKTPPLSASASARQRTKRRSVSTTGTTPDGRSPLTQLPLSVQRERERLREEKLRRKDAETSESSRRNLDKRTARLRYSGDFKADIRKHLQQSPFQSGGSRMNSSLVHDHEKNGVSIFVRKRPIFQYELDRSDYDVVSIESSTADGRAETVVLSNCTMHPDMRRKFIKPMLFPCSAAFDEQSSDDEIYQHVAEPMVQLAARGGVSTILMYGQTGSGKSFTMTQIEKRAASGLFDELSTFEEQPVVTVQFVELAGKSCQDLLSDGEDEVKLAEDEDGSVQLLNAVSVQVASPDELSKQIAKGKSRRATEATEKNGVSSRSHAVCQLLIAFPPGRRKAKRGLLTLIDCAGSERRHDSMYHSSVRQKESAEINASLWALKECIRARALASESRKKIVVPYRTHNLTRLLRESFERDGARLCIIATVAPNATDTEHTMETLKTVSNIVGQEKLIVEGTSREVSSCSEKRIDLVVPKDFSHDQVVDFLERKKIKISVPQRFDGKALMRMNVKQIRAHFFDGAKKDHSEAVFNELRKENDRVAKLQRRERLSISKARKEGGLGQ